MSEGFCSLPFSTCEECEETCNTTMEAYCEAYAYDAEEAETDEEIYSECISSFDSDYCLDYCNRLGYFGLLTEECEYYYNDCNHCIEAAIYAVDEWCTSATALTTPWMFEDEYDCFEYYEGLTYGYYNLFMCEEYCSGEIAEIVAENYEAPEVCETECPEAETVYVIVEQESTGGSFIGTVVTGMVVVGAVGAVLYFFVL